MKPQVDRWGGQDLNLRPTDYEFDPALSPTREIEPRESLTSGFSPQRNPSLRKASQSVAGPVRDTSRAGLAEHRESELLCIHTSERVRLNRGLLPGTTCWRTGRAAPLGRQVVRRSRSRRCLVDWRSAGRRTDALQELPSTVSALRRISFFRFLTDPDLSRLSRIRRRHTELRRSLAWSPLQCSPQSPSTGR
jgi:hypothetical protein